MRSITVRWPETENEHGAPMLWFGSWLEGHEGAEGPWFYSGRGGVDESYPVPEGATGLRVRRWPNEGLDAEYADIVRLDDVARLRPDSLDFDAPQPFSHHAFER
ncbi:MAG: hypothetical protein AB7N24_00700 [Dehalococcoidia bacterium]